MKPTSLKKGDPVLIKPSLGQCNLSATFIKRVTNTNGRQPVNVFSVPEFKGLTSEQDPGLCELSDYDVSRRVSRQQKVTTCCSICKEPLLENKAQGICEDCLDEHSELESLFKATINTQR